MKATIFIVRCFRNMLFWFVVGKPYFGTKDPTGKIQKALEKTDYRKQIINNFTLLYSINEFLGAQNFFQPDSWGTLRTIKHF